MRPTEIFTESDFARTFAVCEPYTRHAFVHIHSVSYRFFIRPPCCGGVIEIGRAHV